MENENINQEEVAVEQKSSLHQVTPLSKYLALALFVILPFLGGWIGYTYAPEKVVEIEKEVIREVVVEKEIEVTPQKNESSYSVETKTYRDAELGIAFEYPAVWGEVTIDDEAGICLPDYVADDCNFRTLLLENVYLGAIFLSAETKGHSDNPVGRGGFWGDLAGDISSNNLSECDQELGCSTVTNSNSVTFALHEADPPPEEMGYQPERYYVYNPDNQYYGLVLSSHRLDSSSPENGRLFKEIVVESFEFIE